MSARRRAPEGWEHSQGVLHWTRRRERRGVRGGADVCPRRARINHSQGLRKRSALPVAPCRQRSFTAFAAAASARARAACAVCRAPSAAACALAAFSSSRCASRSRRFAFGFGAFELSLMFRAFAAGGGFGALLCGRRTLAGGLLWTPGVRLPRRRVRCRGRRLPQQLAEPRGFQLALERPLEQRLRIARRGRGHRGLHPPLHFRRDARLDLARHRFHLLHQLLQRGALLLHRLAQISACSGLHLLQLARRLDQRFHLRLVPGPELVRDPQRRRRPAQGCHLFRLVGLACVAKLRAPAHCAPP